MILEADSASSLLAMLGVARPGDVIRLAPGNYGTVTITGVNVGDVTITSASPSAPAVIAYLNVRNSSGITFSEIEVNPRQGVVGAMVSNSKNIKFDEVDFSSPTTDLTKAGSGLSVRDSSDISVTNSEFYDLIGAVSHINANGLTLSGNKIYNMRSDGFTGTGSDNVVISNNTFTDFYPSGGVHPDAIQMWTATDAPSKNITITGNIITRGNGDIIQGIFITNEGGTGYENVRISGNAVVGTMFQGITLVKATGAVVENNLVLGYADMVSRLTIRDSINVVETGNQATAYIIRNIVNLTDTGNTEISKAVVGDLSVLSAWLKNPLTPLGPIVPTAPVGPIGGGGEQPELGHGEGSHDDPVGPVDNGGGEQPDLGHGGGSHGDPVGPGDNGGGAEQPDLGPGAHGSAPNLSGQLTGAGVQAPIVLPQGPAMAEFGNLPLFGGWLFA